MVGGWRGVKRAIARSLCGVVGGAGCAGETDGDVPKRGICGNQARGWVARS